MISNSKLITEEYESNFRDIHPSFSTEDGALIEANRCLNCYDAPCTKSCPTSIDVPQFIKQISSGNIKGSAKTILQSNIFGAGCARVCPVEKLCEGACVYNHQEQAPIAIARLQRHATERALDNNWNLFERKKDTGKKVAVIGAGPTGLSCAHVLSREGVQVDVYEKESKAGGLMTYGVAAYKVTSDFCKRETEYITALGGINIHYNKTLGKDFTLDEIRSKYDAVLLSIGVGVSRNLNIPGEQTNGVVNAIDFIYQIRTQAPQQIPVGEKVVVVGMGMTAIDAATQAKRLGAKEVTLIYRRTEKEKTCTEKELEIARQDGCSILWLTNPKEVISENGIVKKLICSKIKLDKSKSKERGELLDTGEEIVIEADMIIKATGQLPFAELISKNSITSENGKVKISKNSSTSVKGIFAGGDCVNGGKEVVHAVQDGKNAAYGILEYLKIIK